MQIWFKSLCLVISLNSRVENITRHSNASQERICCSVQLNASPAPRNGSLRIGRKCPFYVKSAAFFSHLKRSVHSISKSLTWDEQRVSRCFESKGATWPPKQSDSGFRCLFRFPKTHGNKEEVVVSQQSKDEQFRELHILGNPSVLYSICDGGNAKAVAEAGAKAIATGSWAVAEVNGFSDGEHVPFDLVIDNLRRIVKATTLPVNVDLENGYGATSGDVHESIAQAIDAGATGCNLEDRFPADGELSKIADQAARSTRSCDSC